MMNKEFLSLMSKVRPLVVDEDARVVSSVLMGLLIECYASAGLDLDEFAHDLEIGKNLYIGTLDLMAREEEGEGDK